MLITGFGAMWLLIAVGSVIAIGEGKPLPPQRPRMSAHSGRRREVAVAAGQGRSNAQISDKLFRTTPIRARLSPGHGQFVDDLTGAVPVHVLRRDGQAQPRETPDQSGDRDLLGVGEAVHDNASQSLIPGVVADRDLEQANSRLLTVERVGQDLAGPSLGGVLFVVAAAAPFSVQAACIAAAVILMTRVRTPPPEAAGPVLHVKGLFKQAAEGLRWLRNTAAVRTIVVTGAAFTFLTQTWEPLLVLLVTGTMGAGETTFGVVLALGAGGGILGALATPALVRRFESRPLQTAALGVTAGADLALAAFPSPPMAALALGLTSTGFAVWNVLSVTMRQRQVPATLLARVNAANRTLSMTAALLGALAGGAIAQLVDLRAPLWLSGAALAVVAVLFALHVRKLAAASTSPQQDPADQEPIS
jgi:hypothetical protein